MNVKKLVLILIGIVFVSFGIGIFSLINIDGFNLSDLKSAKGISFNSGNLVRLGLDGIEVRDGDNRVVLGKNGIYVRSGNENIEIGLDGIKVNGKDSTDLNFDGKFEFNLSEKDIVETNINEEKYEEVNSIKSININSEFVDVKISSEEREDIKIKYYGKIRANLIPKLETEKNSNSLAIKLTASRMYNCTIVNSDAVLEVIVPKNFEGNYTISSSSSDIFASNLKGNSITAESSSGNLTLSNIASNLTLSTASGDIKTDNILGSINAKSASGDINLNINNSTENVNITATSGDVIINFDDSSNYLVSGNTISGDINIDSSINVNSLEKNKFEFSIGTGNKTMKISTVSGDVSFNTK